jgi:hypothetical protein
MLAQILDSQRNLDLGLVLVQPAAQPLLDLLAPAMDGATMDLEYMRCRGHIMFRVEESTQRPAGRVAAAAHVIERRQVSLDVGVQGVDAR